MKTKQDFVNALSELGHDKADLETMTLSELKSLYAESTETAQPASTPTETKAVAESKAEKSVAVYTKQKGKDVVLRTYSESVHGKDYADLANQFVAKFGNKYFIKK